MQDVINCGVGLFEMCGEELEGRRRSVDISTRLFTYPARTFCWPSWLSDETPRHWNSLEGWSDWYLARAAAAALAELPESGISLDACRPQRFKDILGKGKNYPRGLNLQATLRRETRDR